MDSENRRRFKRKPLSDCTNTTPISYTIKCKNKPKPSLSNKRPDENSLNNENSSIGSNNDKNPINPQHKSSQFYGLLLTLVDSIVIEGSEVGTVYSQQSIEKKGKRKREGKTVAVMMPLTCPPVGRIRSFVDRLKHAHRGDGLSEVCSVCHLEGKKKQRRSMNKGVSIHSLSEDFVNKQRAYFAEIDAFELQEEVVSESELE
ncbi:uncharacterized protein LOC143859224 isoform X2 [Tasmannia lanceolata]|uniref:uncharacterized protein LOC143859224 isoform X2 n=1 Tax=Tasmannia lanceolata TaxID=3420 RepID=UPI0040647FC0